MTGRIEDYALIGDNHTVALVGIDGSIDWLCMPRFDSPACFAALVGDDENGHWLLAPSTGGRATSRRYVGDTLVLETTWESDAGCVTVTDFMPHRDEAPDVVRVVNGVRGSVDMCSQIRLRFDYGSRVPWMRRLDGQLAAVAGPDAVYLRGDVDFRGEGFATVSDFTVAAGERVGFVLTWKASHLPVPRPVDIDVALEESLTDWQEWADGCTDAPQYAEALRRSLLTLKAMTFQPTGGIVAAATTSLPEDIGGERNWDYRYCWLRDATLTLEALLRSGYTEEAAAWRGWLMRAIAGSPTDLQIMYGVAGEARLDEYTADWLGGYEGSQPVRIGNAAAKQLQLDVFGEVIDALSVAEESGVDGDRQAWSLRVAMIDHLETIWQEPDEGIWETRGGRQNFTHSKVMCWVAFDRMATAVETGGKRGKGKHWRAIADQIQAEVCAHAYDDKVGAFMQAYGSDKLDAAVLLIPRLGFLPPDDPRVVSTVEVISKRLVRDGFVMRYDSGPAGANGDGLQGSEGSFLACSFWLVDALYMVGREDEARGLFDRLLALRNDVGLLAEEYDTRLGRQVGNFPQAFSHIGLVNSAFLLAGVPPRLAQK